MKISYIFQIILLFSALILSNQSNAQVTGLSNYTLFLDPGHSQQENMGLYNYSEAEKTLRVALELRKMFEEQTDINAIHMSRTNDDDKVSLSERSDLANSLGVDFYYSLHSDAGSPLSNSVLTMYGGWRKDGITIEKTPNGGKAFGNILNTDLSGAMRIGNRGNYADRIFYQGPTNTHSKQHPYLYVNRTTNMASLLSEAGFHTNPQQQQRNLNKNWKKLEALSIFRSFLKFRGLECPPVGIATGIIRDEDTNLPINGAIVSIGNKKDTTDTYTSLFNQFSNQPNLLKNGFYWIEGLTPEDEVEVVFSADSYQTKTENLTIKSNTSGETKENLSFLDVVLTSTVAPTVSDVNAENGLNNVAPKTDKITITFNRKMNRASVEEAIYCSPEAKLSFIWEDDFTIYINTDSLAFATNYQFTIDGTKAKNSATMQLLDGDNDGQAGGNYSFNVTTSEEDNTAPELIEKWPSAEHESPQIRPVIRMVFSEKIDNNSILSDAIILKAISDNKIINGAVRHTITNDQSVLHFFPLENLTNHKNYQVDVKAGLKDIFGNATEAISFSFMVKEQEITSLTSIDNFNSGIKNWWKPQASGTTAGILTEKTNWLHDKQETILSLSSTGSMQMNYAWDIAHGNPYIREYLPASSAQNNNKFNIDDVLQMYVFGDGSGNEFRFVIRDGNSKYEASNWYKINWKGWKLISWILAKEPVNGWVNGNGILDGSGFSIDGIHMRYVNGALPEGTLWFDELRFVKRNAYIPLSAVALNTTVNHTIKMYPNPAKDHIKISSKEEIISLSIKNSLGQLIQSEKPNSFNKTLHIEHLKQGIYFVTVHTKKGTSTKKLQVIGR